MAYVKIEPSGCCERKGLMQVRFCMYLEDGDYGYEQHHIQSQDGTWRDNPFHNHFIYVEPEISDDEIMDIGEAFLHEAYIKWSSGAPVDLKNEALARPTGGYSTAEIIRRVESLKGSKFEKRDV